MKISKELMKGSTVTLVLTLLERKAMYGYEMIKEMESRSSGVFQFKEGTLYPILHQLEAEGFVEAYWFQEEGSRKRKYYRITERGRQLIAEKTREWSLFRNAVDQVLGEGRA
ncbi:PadR family transcriptional regulator [Paenibacillus sp. MBLB4367]|uniref:PadR family transcriptional regulator n=1 Tax=Paenibacillus sp. MBLB4367 TaxID=3384767 RepID=UPI003907FA7E